MKIWLNDVQIRKGNLGHETKHQNLNSATIFKFQFNQFSETKKGPHFFKLSLIILLFVIADRKIIYCRRALEDKVAGMASAAQQASTATQVPITEQTN